jgi:putative redox protein
MEMKAEVKWTDELQFVARAGSGPAVVLDNRGRIGPSPMEMVLMGVAGCTAMDVASIMQKKRARMKRFQVNISGERAEQHPRRYTRITIEYLLEGKAIKPKDVEQAIALSETKYCSATASLKASIEHTYRIIEEEA